jgi:hypothetical protein
VTTIHNENGVFAVSQYSLYSELGMSRTLEKFSVKVDFPVYCTGRYTEKTSIIIKVV